MSLSSGRSENVMKRVIAVLEETGMAWKLELEEITDWFPKSQCELYLGTGFVSISKWLCERKDLSVKGDR